MLLKPNADFEKSTFYYILHSVFIKLFHKKAKHIMRRIRMKALRFLKPTGLMLIPVHKSIPRKSSVHAPVCVLLHGNNCPARTEPIYIAS